MERYIKEGLLKIKVVPNSSKSELKEVNGELKLYLKEVPEKGKANKEIVKFFKKKIGMEVEIKYGLRSRNKTLRIINKV
ncbi:YggU family protein [Candidatus Woesearchaeota archaeon]|jgi:uncharacterized protein|nr:YggU family protein [Candidatus Woesearchaeota archaeon]